MGNIMVSKLNLFSFFEQSHNKEKHKVVVCDSEGTIATSLDFFNSYNSVKNIFFMADITDCMRVAIITKEAISMQLLAVPIMDMAVLTPIDPTMKPMDIKKFLILLSVDFAVIDEKCKAASIAAEEIGIGYALFDSYEKTNTSDFKFKLVTKAPDQPLNKELKHNNQVFINTTSGTTSIPKIVPIYKKQYLAGLTRRMKIYDYTDNEKMLLVTKPYRSQTINRVILMIKTGGTVVIMKTLKPHVIVDTINKHKITSMTAPPALLVSIAKYIKNDELEYKFENLRFIKASGAPMPEKTKIELEKAFSTRVLFSYGMTETRNIANTYREPCGHKLGSVGTGSGLELRVVEGEIQVKGDSVFKGYENSDIDNRDYFIDGWFRTGDLGNIDQDGYVYITGRIKEMINRGGEKVSPYEVEEAILELNSVIHTAVFPYPNSFGSENVAAVVVMKNDVDINIKFLRQFLKNRIQGFKIPTLLYCVDSIPVGENGKIQRRKLFDIFNKKHPETRFKVDKKFSEKNLTKMEKNWLQYGKSI